jgi:tetratricopeptide (TPR) repeat protein
MAVVAVTLFFASVEGVLWAFGLSPLAETHDPFLGFSQRVHVFRLAPSGGVYQTAPGAAPAFNPQRFRAKKPEGAFRVFVLGGSSAYGFPWGAQAAFARHLRDALRASWPERTIEVINAAGMSYASHRVRIVAHEVLGYQPDLLVIYSGHNEFVERGFYETILERPKELDAIREALHHTRLYSAMTRLYRKLSAAKEVSSADGAPRELKLEVQRRPLLDAYSQDREEVRASFEENLSAVVDAATAAGVPVILCTVPSNVRDWAPQRTSLDPHLSAEDREALEQLLTEGLSAVERGDYGAAVEAYEAGRELAPNHASVHFELGRAYEALERWEDARASYIRARDTDGRPERAVSELNATIRRLAIERDVPLVDVEHLFEGIAPHQLLGFNLFEDYVHPNPEGHRLIALALWKQMLEEGSLGERRHADEDTFWSAVNRRGAAQLAADLPRRTANLLFNLGVVLDNAGQDQQALEKFKEAVEVAPTYWGAWLNIGLLEAKRGRYEEAVTAFRNVLLHQPGHPQALMSLGLSLYHLQEFTQAEQVFDQATRGDPTSAIAWKRLGIVRLVQRRPAEAALREAISLDPSNPELRRLLTRATAMQPGSPSAGP